MREVSELLQRCAVYYFSGTLTAYCEQRQTCPLVPQECLYFNAAYMILHVLTDIGFMKDGKTELTNVAFSLMIIPSQWFNYDKRVMAKFYMDTYERKVVTDGDITITAMALNIDKQVFNSYVVADIPWYILAMSIVVVILLVYMQSVVLMIAVVANVLITLCLSYFIYYYIFQVKFFPFLNLTAALLLIAIGADDVFIVYDLWRQQLRQNPTASYEEIMSETLRKGGLSIFVTSLTTAAALFSNLASSITTIRCFGIFAGICMLVNFILMITWIPALIIITEKTFNHCVDPSAFKGLRALRTRWSAATEYFWGVVVMRIITKGSPLWVLLHLAMGLLGLIAVFLKPGLKLSDDSEIKVFGPEHPFEIYNIQYRYQIRIELELKYSRSTTLQMIWGVDAAENGNVFDPDDQSVLVFSPLEIYSVEAVTWLNQFCDQLKEQPFVSEQIKGYDCYFRVVEKLLAGPCDLEPNDTQWKSTLDIRPCCGMSLPVNETALRNCMKHLAYITNGDLHRITGTPVLGEIILDKDDIIRIFRYFFPSNRAISHKFQYVDSMVRELNDFMPGQLQTAPGMLNQGGYCSGLGFELRFYDLQKALSIGTLIGVGISLGTAFIVLLVTSLNLILAFYAIVTISLVIACTIGTLVMLGWELNVSESVTITLSLGLAVDFTIHYGVAYKLSSGTTRSERVKDVVQSVSSAVTMAALTTLVTGLAVLPGKVLAYRQFGIFLAFIMLYSWLFSTLFFLSICYGIGPIGNMGDIMYILRCCREKKKKKKKTPDTSTAPDDNIELPPSYTDGSLNSFQRGVYVTQLNSSRTSPMSAHGSVDSKLMSSSEAIIRLPTGRASGGSHSTTDNIIVITDPVSKRGSNARSKHRRRSDGGRHRPRSRRDYDDGDATSSSASTDESSSKYVYNVHVYCIGDVNNASGKKRRAKREKQDYH
jgi:predicted RND superfamily exporter protein